MTCRSLGMALVFVIGTAAWPAAQGTSGAKLATEVCAACHGSRGESGLSPAFPRLAGQRAGYLELQLKAFRNRARADPMAQAFMWGMSSQLTDAQITQLAAYYAMQKPVKGKPGAAALVQAGAVIFQQGIPAANVTACVSCHGPHAEGQGLLPRLVGQHAEYLLKQLLLFQSEQRTNGSSAGSSAGSTTRADKDWLAPIMHVAATGMTFEQMEAVAAYEAAQ